MSPDRIDADCGRGFPFLMVDANAQSAIREPEQKVTVPVGMASHHIRRPRNTVYSP